MHPLLSLSLCWLLPLALMAEEDLQLDCVPRRTVPYHRDNGYLFREEGVSNYSIMLLREDLGLLVLGAREAIYALDLHNISNKNASVKWEATDTKKEQCENKGKNAETECKNYIRILHTMEDGRMYVCGTYAFDPECDYMSYANGKLTLEKTGEDGKGKCPFDPFQRYSFIMVGNDLYSATSMNFLGSEPVMMRSLSGDSSVSVRTEFKSSWLHEPTFVSMAQMPESENSGEGDDDKVYLFFSENAVECDCNKLVVSRVARVCKGDMGGQRTLQKKWTSFLKARVDCPVLESQMPYIIQDTFRWCEPQQHWKSCVFYAVFTPQSDTSDLSAVCAYRVSDISRVFSEGKYKNPVTVETSFVKWVMYTGDVPSPRPGACIDNEARKQGITQTLDLPDRTLQFIRDRPLMDQTILPINGRPLLVRRGAAFTRIIVNQVQAADGKKYHVMFIGTEEGTVLKAVNYDREMFIIEEVELFQPPEPIKVLRFSNVTGQLYAGSENGAVQMPLANCGRSLSCMDCVLARDPYCGWDNTIAKCIALSDAQRDLIQSVKQGLASRCPDSEPVKPVNMSIGLGCNLKLDCPPPSNLAKTSWQQDAAPLLPSTRLQLLKDGLLIFNALASDAGRYRCLSVEHSNSGKYTTTVAEYQVSLASGSGRGVGQTSLPEAQRDGPSVAGLQAAVGLLVVLLAALLAWNLYKGHLPLPWRCGDKSGARRGETQEPSEQRGHGSGVTHQDALRPASAEAKSLVSGADSGSSNNNHTGGPVAFNVAEETVAPVSLQYIDDESEI
ncbi:semaphorin-4E [Centroberyx gerrardi]|uniref:semaphorin-4E n=1 Tax=Centroberyx gerrardi TaxID=166262 RepID=UPI003AB00818